MTTLKRTPTKKTPKKETPTRTPKNRTPRKSTPKKSTPKKSTRASASSEGLAAAAPRTRLELDPDDMQRSLMRLLLSLAGFVRDLLERQTLRRLERKTLSAEEVERLGRALMQLERTIEDLARQFDLDLKELNLGLGPLGRLRD